MDQKTYEERLLEVAANYSRQIAYLRAAIDKLTEERETLKEQLRQAHLVIQALKEVPPHN